MLFNSLQFFIFFCIVYPFYLFLRHKQQNILILIASCIFYGAWDWRFLLLMFVSISTDYFCALTIDRKDDERARKRILWISLGVNLAILGFFKYFNFFAGSLQGLLQSVGISISLKMLNIVLPVGISFYTFQAMSYVIDVYRRQIRPVRHYCDYALFVTFFPQLVAGPIMRAKDLLSQILSPRQVTLDGFCEGSFLFFWGIFEKVFLASNLAKIVDPIFAHPAPYTFAEVLLGLYAFAFQIFCDFDGYSNMARGLGKMMGFEIMFNFNLPYFATNPRDFWQRWHISLSQWLRDYVYIPLGGGRGSLIFICRNLFLTMLLGGFWHGASWTFVVWGAFHGTLLVIHRFCLEKIKILNDCVSKVFKPVRIILFFHCIVFGWLFFRAKTFTQMFAMLESLFTPQLLSNQEAMAFIHLTLMLLPLLIVQIVQYYRRDLMVIYKMHWIPKTIIYAFLAYLIIGWGVMKAEEFIYFQF